MKLTFTEEHIKNELNKFYLEEDDLMMEGEYITGEGKNYIISGVATIEGERYHEFEIEFELLEEPAEETIESIMAVEWDWYDFLC
jgi:CRISPR/Cas system-associated exonuclease Cas4 (RecB family)